MVSHGQVKCFFLLTKTLNSQFSLLVLVASLSSIFQTCYSTLLDLNILHSSHFYATCKTSQVYCPSQYTHSCPTQKDRNYYFWARKTAQKTAPPHSPPWYTTSTHAHPTQKKRVCLFWAQKMSWAHCFLCTHSYTAQMNKIYHLWAHCLLYVHFIESIASVHSDSQFSF